jgi:hypothetical protein
MGETEPTNPAAELGKRGGQTTLKKHGTEHFRRMKQLSDEAKKKKKNSPIDNRLLGV